MENPAEFFLINCFNYKTTINSLKYICFPFPPRYDNQPKSLFLPFHPRKKIVEFQVDFVRIQVAFSLSSLFHQFQI